MHDSFNPESVPPPWPDPDYDDAKWDWVLTVITGFGLSIIGIFAIIMLMILASCGGGSSVSSKPSPKPISGAPSPPTAWTLWFSPGVTLGAGPSFNFPTWVSSCPGPTGFNQTCPAVHYLVNRGGVLLSGQSVIMTATVAGSSPQWNYNNIENDGNTCVAPATVRFFIQEAGDDWSGNGAFAYYRWWSTQAIPLQLGTFTLTVPLIPGDWSSVMGAQGDSSPAATAGFNQALASAQAIGMTFGGGCFYGHGVDLTGGSATFTVDGFTVQ